MFPEFVRPAAVDGPALLQVRAAYSTQRPVLRNNFGLVKLFLVRWAPAVQLPVAACLSHLRAPVVEDSYNRRLAMQRRLLGIRLFSAGAPLTHLCSVEPGKEACMSENRRAACIGSV